MHHRLFQGGELVVRTLGTQTGLGEANEGDVMHVGLGRGVHVLRLSALEFGAARLDTGVGQVQDGEDAIDAEV